MGADSDGGGWVVTIVKGVIESGVIIGSCYKIIKALKDKINVLNETIKSQATHIDELRKNFKNLHEIQVKFVSNFAAMGELQQKHAIGAMETMGKINEMVLAASKNINPPVVGSALNGSFDGKIGPLMARKLKQRGVLNEKNRN